MKLTRWLIVTSLLGMSGCPFTWSSLQDLTPPPGAPAKARQAAGSGSAASQETGRRAAPTLSANS